MPVNPNNVLRPGIVLQEGKYVIEKALGEGGFGVTYLATEVLLKRPVAIKELYPKGSQRVDGNVRPPAKYASQWASWIGKFLDEAATLARMRHLSIVIIYSYFEENDTAYLVMEYIDGKNLEEIVEEHGPLSPQIAMTYIEQVGDALKVLHSNGVIHRDIKPNNIMLNKDSRAVLIDFGAAREFVLGKTLTHTIIWTPGYAPMEQLQARAKRAPYIDIYALAATAHYLLTAEIPALDSSGVLENIAGLSPALFEPIKHGLAPSPADRPQSVTSFVDEIRAAGGQAQSNSEEMRPVADKDEPQDPGSNPGFYSVFMLSIEEGWIVGEEGRIMHYTGKIWEEVKSPVKEALQSIQMISPNAGWAVGEQGTILKYKNGRWMGADSPVSVDLNEVSMSPADGSIWVAGTDTLAFHYSEGRWETEQIFVEDHYVEYSLNSIVVISEKDAWIVGDSGLILHRVTSSKGCYWSQIGSPITKDLHSIFMTSAQEGWAVGDEGTILHYINGVWMKAARPTRENLYHVFMLGKFDGWIVGDNTILHYDGEAWDEIDCPIYCYLNSICVLPSGEGWAVGDEGIILHYQNGTWSEYSNNPTL